MVKCQKLTFSNCKYHKPPSETCSKNHAQENLQTIVKTTWYTTITLWGQGRPSSASNFFYLKQTLSIGVEGEDSKKQGHDSCQNSKRYVGNLFLELVIKSFPQ